MIRAHVRNGVIIPDSPAELPEGAEVRVEVIQEAPPQSKRQGGWWRGQVVIADDFNELPDDIAEAFGMLDK